MLTCTEVAHLAAVLVDMSGPGWDEAAREEELRAYLGSTPARRAKAGVWAGKADAGLVSVGELLLAAGSVPVRFQASTWAHPVDCAQDPTWRGWIGLPAEVGEGGGGNEGDGKVGAAAVRQMTLF